MKKLGFIGAGRVAFTIGRYMRDHGYEVAGYISRTKKSATEAATFTQTGVYDTLEKLVCSSDIILITTPDDNVASVWSELSRTDIRGKYIGTTSGSLSSLIFTDSDAAGAHCFSLHPMYAFSDRYTSYLQFHTAALTIEGDDDAIELISDIFTGLGHAVYRLHTDKKVRYHAAASILSNMFVGLYDIGISMLTDCGFTMSEAKELADPLVIHNIHSVVDNGVVKALTGPIERGDADTVYKHMNSLTACEKAVYSSIGKRLMDIAVKKNPDRDYARIKRYFDS